MENSRTSAHFENREYFYTLISKSPTEVKVRLYSTDYLLIKDKEGKWVNHHSSRNAMSAGLIQAVIEAVDPELAGK